jgi:PAS domain S-box-containing protein
VTFTSQSKSRTTALHTKLTLALSILVALVVGGSALLVIRREQDRRLVELNVRATQYADLLSRSLALPLWNVDVKAIDRQLAALFNNHEVTELGVTGLNYGPVSTLKKTEPIDTADKIVRVRTIEHSAFPTSPSEAIGEVRVVLSSAETESSITAFRRAVILIAGAIIAGLYAVTYLLVRLMVGRPVRRLEQTVELSEYLTGQVFERSPDGICIVGRDYRFQRVNPVYERIWATPAEGIVDRHVAELMGSETFERVLRPNYERCFAGEEVGYAEWLTYGDVRRYVNVTYSPLRPNSDQVDAVLVIIHDLTDHMLSSEALRRVQAELAHVNRVATMGQLTASIAHEVNQPIGAVSANAQAAIWWLAANPPNLDKVRGSLRYILADSQRAGDVIGRIRALVKKEPTRKDRFDINQAVVDVVALTQNEVLTHSISLRTEFATELPLVEGDRVQLQQVMLNLVINAIEAMSGKDTEARVLRITTERDASETVLVTVQDSGPGLDLANADLLFEPFYTTKPTGMGVGLAICRSIIEAHGGRLWVGANEEQGAAFHFTVPLGCSQSSGVDEVSQGRGERPRAAFGS